MKSSERDLKEWIDGCKENDRFCQRKIYEYLYSPMMIVCLRYADDKQEASDILQDAFLKVFDKIGLYNDEGSFEGWVRRIIVNTSIDAIRKKKKEILSDDTSIYQNTEIEDDDADTSPYEGIDVNDVVEAMQKLSPVYQAVFNMYVMDGMTHQEIADNLNISVGTSKSNLSKARQKIKKILIEKLQSNEH
jgi:RNA polymerase sigma-70 factor (ECF subfamily)